MGTHGGARLGAGRRPKKMVIVRKATAEAILSSIDEKKLWVSLLRDPDSRVKLDALKYLVNRRDGLPAQSLAVSGADGEPLFGNQTDRPFIHIHFVESDGDGRLPAGYSDDEAQTIDG